ncbi:YkvA family protein [Clostridium massiliamazoniense]|uniref:YkvA family protein n=1 Tax=Clostridium massiliamazoniense TaxID=1347366 RepID=UPI0006D7E011|nr:YkvA family protein [Clostridium massiliamazoniense]
MNISQITVSLSADDIKSMVNDFMKIEGLNLNEIIFEGNSLKVAGSFKKVISLGFSASVEVVGVENNILTLGFKKASFMKIGILKVFRKIALKIALKGFKEKGIEIVEDKIKIDIKKIIKDMKFINLDLTEARVANGKLDVAVSNINVNLPEMANKPSISVEEEAELDNIKEEKVKDSNEKKEEEPLKKREKENLESDDLNDSDYVYNINIEKTEDVYSHSRDAIVKNIPNNAKAYSDFIMFIPDLIALICRLIKDKRVPKKTRIALGLSFGYTVLPFDLIPDKIPVLGQLDELAVILFALERIMSDVDTNVLLENWQGKDELVIVLKQAVEYISGFTGAKNLNKIYDVIDALT